ncbi:prepilin peptidase [Bacillus tuaregi]|uniref:prepilin peptidase n=1 Tax=Bacillus tuaregi TaxID=1816695 RepID=UPI0008F957DB|nr:A24 family peptidase [Bacillus tuaregi]
MTLIYSSIILIYGIILGSFYNVVALRIPAGESIVKPRSHCPKCGHVLGALELIPVLSYILQKGKCRSCKAPISPLYALVELATGLLFVSAPLVMGWTSELFVAWTLISLLVIVFVSDYKYMIIPDKVLLFFLPIFLIERFFIPLAPWWDSLLGAAVGFGLLYLIAVISKGGMGGGDIKLYGVLGLVLGVKMVLLSFFLATLLGALFGGIGLLAGKVERGKPIPFGPFICIGVLLAYFFGENILTWYFQLFF